MILLSDANILIDLGYVGGLSLLPALGPTEVLSTILLECEHQRQPNLVAEVLVAGIQVVEVEEPLARAAEAYWTTELSFRDRQALLYARDEGRVLLSGDAPLVSAARRERVEAHGSIWLIEQALQHDVFPAAELCRWLGRWPELRRRLPGTELRRLKALLDCS